MKKFYITTTLPYVNAPLHIGHSLELVYADIITRFKKQLGYEVIFNTGTDEHGLKIYRRAQEEKKDPQAYVDEYAEKFKNLLKILNISNTHFIRTTDKHHILAAQEFWKRCKSNGDIYKAFYKVKYCIGCELEKTDSELENGKCPLHPNLEIEIIEEENYFFKFSKYQSKLLDLYKNNPQFVVPDFRLKEIENFVASGISDFSISRLKSKMPWGIDVPDDDSQVMYVWFDALINYISTLGWPSSKEFNEFWPGVQIAGKDNLRQQSAIWQAMLLSAGLPPSKQIIIHGFITAFGQKMSKTIGNVIYPEEIIKKYGVDALRFWFASEIPPFEDGDFSWEKINQVYNGRLVDGLGNFYSRVLGLAQKLKEINTYNLILDREIEEKIVEIKKLVYEKLEKYLFNEAINYIWELISFGDLYIERTKPWQDYAQNKIFNLMVILDNIAALIYPFLPETSEKITNSIINHRNKMLFNYKGVLFPKI